MRIAYFHGWKSTIDERKVKILAKFGDEIYYPSIDYQTEKNLINSFANDLYSGPPALIVGSSLGGYLGFHISNIVRFPALLINPAFFLKSGGELRPNTNSSNNDFMDKDIFFSLKDEEIDVKRCIKYLKTLGYEDSKISFFEDFGHRIPLDVFENIFSEFREKYKDFKFEKDTPQKKKYYSSKPGENYYNGEEEVAAEDIVEDRPMRVAADEAADNRWWEEPPQVRPMIKNPKKHKLPTSIAQDLVSVQPMSTGTGQILTDTTLNGLFDV